MKNICILIPVFNEAKAIGALVKEIKDKSFDVIVVDDGSTDQSGIIAQNSGAHVIRHDERSGKGFALHQGMEYVLQHGYHGVLIMDGDGQHSVSDIPSFLKIIDANQAHIVIGNRLQNPEGMPIVRLWTNKIMSWMISLACGQKVPDTQCGFRFISAQVLNEIHLQRKSYEVETEVLMKTAKKGHKIYSTPIQTIYGDEVSKINPMKDTFKFLSYFFKELFSSK